MRCRTLPTRRVIILLAAFAVAGCARSTGSASTARTDPAQPTPVVIGREHAAVDLTGIWATGSVGEPAAQRILLRVQCNTTPAHWIIEQSGDSVRAWVMPASYAQGIATSQPVSTVGAQGRVSGLDFATLMAGARYLLRYDSTSGHLRGTLNGAAFWAARLQIVRPDDCIPPP